MEQFNVIINQLFQFFVMLLTGYIAARSAVASEAFLGGLSRLIMRVLLPVLIFANATNGTSRSQLLGSYPVLLLTVVMFTGLILLFTVTAKIAGLKGERSRVFRACFVFGNAGFIGIPLLTAIFPENGAVYVVLISIVDQLFLWTYGLYMTKPRQKGTFRLRNFINPALCAIALAVLLLLLDVPFPAVFSAPLLTIGRAATPLSLIYLGGLLHYCDWKAVLREREIYLGMLLKMLVYPVIFYRLADLTSASSDMVLSVAVLSALPTMTSIAMFAKAENNEGEYALGLVLVTTILSLLTLTAVSYVIF